MEAGTSPPVNSTAGENLLSDAGSSAWGSVTAEGGMGGSWQGGSRGRGQCIPVADSC